MHITLNIKHLWNIQHLFIHVTYMKPKMTKVILAGVMCLYHLLSVCYGCVVCMLRLFCLYFMVACLIPPMLCLFCLCVVVVLFRDYAAIVFFASNRFETGKRKLQYLTFQDFAFCAGQLINNWTLGSLGENLQRTLAK